MSRDNARYLFGLIRLIDDRRGERGMINCEQLLRVTKEKKFSSNIIVHVQKGHFMLKMKETSSK